MALGARRSRGVPTMETRVVIAAGNFTMASEGMLVVNKTSGAATQVTLTPTPDRGATVTVKDGKGDAATNNITVIGAASATIDGAASFVMSKNYASTVFVWNGTEWNALGSAGTSGALTDVVGASTAAAGTTTADAGVLPAGTGSVYPTTAADDTKGVRINAADQVTGRRIFIGNGVANKILKIYAPSGGVINGAAADAAFSTASGKGATLVCLSGSGNTWLGY